MGATYGVAERVREGETPTESRYVRYGPGEKEVDVILDNLGIEYLTPTQDLVIREQRRLVLVTGGERAGKSFVSGLFGATRTPYGERFWIVGPDYALARPEFNYWVEHLQVLGAIRSDRDISVPKIGPASAVTKTGQIIETKTSDDTAKLAAVAPSGIIMAEAAQQDYDTYLRCIGRVAENRGWLLMSGTLEGSLNWYADLYNEWLNPENYSGGVAYSMPSWDNLLIYPGGRFDPEILRLEAIYSRVEGLFEERCGAVPVPSHNLVFREFRTSIHMNAMVKYDPALPVYLAVDPAAGTNPYAVLACQFHKHEREELHPDPIDYCHIIDEVYFSGKICEEMIEICKTKRWWDSVRGGAIDIEAPDDKKRWLKLGKVVLHSEKIHQLSGIRRLKSFLYYAADPKTGRMIDTPHLQIAPRVKSLPYEFSKFRRELPKDDDHIARDLVSDTVPNHSIKALWYLLIARYGEVKASRIARPAYNWQRRV